MRKYKACKAAWRTKIDEVEAERETGSSIWVNGRRSLKRTEWENYFDSWDEAHKFLMSLAQAEVEMNRLALERAKGHLGNIKGMKKPA